MSLIKKSSRAFLLGGIFFVVPLLVIIILFKKAFQLILPLSHRLVEDFGLHSVLGAATVTIIGIFILLFICYLSGYLIEKGFIRQWSSLVEEKLFLFFPSFQMLKYRIIGDQPKGVKMNWQAVLLKENNYYRLAFITDKSNPGFLSLYLPDAPRMDAGEIRYMPADECDFLPLPMKDAMNVLNSFGRGLPASHLIGDK